LLMMSQPSIHKICLANHLDFNTRFSGDGLLLWIFTQTYFSSLFE
jgi:hypothetical protein